MKLLLHICCGVCAAGSVEKLLPEGYRLTGFYFNPNIGPMEEYEKRLAAAKIIAGIMDFPLVVPPYAPEKWIESTKSLAQEPEGGKRCEICFRIRLQATYDYFLNAGFEAFSTTLTIGPQKSTETINRIGREIGGDKFLARDLKKQGGSQRAVQLAKQHQIYRQNYCGCIYSVRKP